jgi:poly-gamma-glutamate synthesis protein (capsule biosynthesis protein)
MKYLISLSFLLIVLLGCQAAPTTALPTLQPTAVAQVTVITVTSVPPTPILVPTATPTATAVPPTATPLPPITIAVAPQWQTAVAAILPTLTESSDRTWELLLSEDPAAELAANQAQIALTSDGGGALVYQEPLVIAVPFSTDWHFITQTDAEAIVANGHQLARALPWHEMTPDWRALRVNGLPPDDPAYPLQNRLLLQAAPGLDTAVAQLQTHLQTTFDTGPVIHLATVGDIMLDRGPGIVLQQGDLAYPFAKVAPLLQMADITVGNLESALGDVGEPMPKAYPFRAPPQAAEALALAGFDIVSLANNHGMDYGTEALLQGIDLLKAAGVQPIGGGANAAEARAPYITEVNGLTMAFLGYVNVPVEASSSFDVRTWDATDSTAGIAWGEPERITEDVTAVRGAADLVVVVLHSAFEYLDPPSEPQMILARAAVDAGADLVIGHHAHVLQGVEFYGDGVIIYGLGNFAFEIDGDPSTGIMNVWLDADGVRELELIPAIIQFGGQPRLADEWEAAVILERVYRLSRSLNGR